MKNKNINPVVAGTIIAAAGVTAAVLSNKENRKKAGKALKKLKVRGDEARRKAEEKIRDKAKDVVSRESKKISSKITGKSKKASKGKRTSASK